MTPSSNVGVAESQSAKPEQLDDLHAAETDPQKEAIHLFNPIYTTMEFSVDVSAIRAVQIAAEGPGREAPQRLYTAPPMAAKPKVALRQTTREMSKAAVPISTCAP